MNRCLVTGSCGLVGSECVRWFASQGWEVHGIDNNGREQFLGRDGDTRPRLQDLRTLRSYSHHAVDIRDALALEAACDQADPQLIVHAAAQPSHDACSDRPETDWAVNASATLTLLDWARRRCPEAPFVFLSTNKVYGTVVNEWAYTQQGNRWEPILDVHRAGVDEECRVDHTMHSPFGVSKLAADLMVQEFGRYYGMPTVCLRAGCITGAAHAGTERHGFLSYLARCVVEGARYIIRGYGGLQVRDNVHASDIARFVEMFAKNPKSGAVYNIGGGRGNSCSILEGLELAGNFCGKMPVFELSDQERRGDHRWWITDTTRLGRDYDWSPQIRLSDIMSELVCAWAQRLAKNTL